MTKQERSKIIGCIVKAEEECLRHGYLQDGFTYPIWRRGMRQRLREMADTELSREFETSLAVSVLLG